MAVSTASCCQVPCGAAINAAPSRWHATASAGPPRTSRNTATAAATGAGCCSAVTRQQIFGPQPAWHTPQGSSACRHTKCDAAAAQAPAQGTAPAAPAPAPPRQAAPPPPSRAEHNETQVKCFCDPAAVQRSLRTPDKELEKNLERIAAAVPDLGPASRVVDVGCGAGALIPFLQARGVESILAVDLAQPMLDAVAKKHPPPATVEALGVHTWCGDIVDLAATVAPLGTVDAVFFKSSFAHMHDQHEALWACCRMLRPGGHIVISHPLGRVWSSRISNNSPKLVPHSLPDVAEMQRLIHDLPLRSVDAQRLRNSLYPDGSLPDGLYLRVLQVPEGYAFDNMFYDWKISERGSDGLRTHDGFELRRQPQPLLWKAKVVMGHGHRSKGLLPMANLDPQDCRMRLGECFDLAGDAAADAITPPLWQMPKGVYFGFARLNQGSSHGRPDADFEVHSMVMTIGQQTATGGGDGTTIEVHIFDHDFASDFHGLDMTVQICGFLRPELKFDGTPALMAQLQTDIGIARTQLALPLPQKWQQMTFTSADKNITQLEHQAKQRQALLRGVQLPADASDRMHELRLYKKVADTLNANIERNKLATFATVAKALGVKGERVFQAVTASPKEVRSGVAVDQFRSTGASHSAFVTMVARVAVASGMAADGSSERALREQVELALKNLDDLTNDVLAYRCSKRILLGRQLTRKEVATVTGLDIKRVQQLERAAMATLRRSLEQAGQSP